ncbi:transporter substrate-binding domain-containing protein [Companilactobacillus metriopterae]|uniref:transporter substrate-binding domain-containing protein n=1 Tax=Companilactobacillus metriopterae TaxID=1909267 RepID=UPI00100BA941|nr:transporter substrate-binding domain-containing protein [Companilactobacillus metriopterae]
MKKKITAIISILAMFVLILSGCSSSSKSVTQEQGTLTIGLEGTYAPYSYRENGKLTGFEVELGKDLAKEMGMKAKFVPTKWDSLIAGLNSKTFDVVLNNVAINSSRKKQYIFATPYVYSKSVLITKEGNKDITSVKDLKGKKMAEGTGTDNWLNAEKFGGNISPSTDFATTMSMIKDGRVDATINSKEAYLTYIKDSKTTGLQYRVVSSKDIKASEIAPIMNKNSTELQKEMNKAMNKLQKDGTLKKLSIKYFGEDITQK